MKMPPENIQYVSIMDYEGGGARSTNRNPSGALKRSINKFAVIWLIFCFRKIRVTVKCVEGIAC